MCSEVGPVGAECARDDECTSGLLCNHGHRPDDARLGECRAPGVVGDVCGWGGPGDDDHNPDALFGHGCAPGLVCAPALPDLPTSATLDPATTGCSALAHDCGYVGVCTTPGTVADGGACLGHDACASGRCLHVTAPHGDESSDLFGLGGGEYVGAWPDRCAALDALGENALCADTPERCMAGTYCDRSTNVARCVAFRQGIETQDCGVRAQPSLGSDLECRVGLICLPLGGGMRCQEPGTAGEGAACVAFDCAPGLACHLDASDGRVCQPLGEVGASCAPGEVPCALGLLCDASNHCSEP